jgi:hypothetical protein
MEITGRQVRDASIQRVDLDISTPGQAVITKLIAGSGVTLSQTGADAGTGDVTINVTGGGGGGAPKFHARFALGEAVLNTPAYFYTARSLGSTQDDKQRSGNSAGLSYANSCSPFEVQKAGTITEALLRVYGLGVNNGSVSLPATYTVNIYRVGASAEQDPTVNSGSPNVLSFPITTGTVGLYSIGAGAWVVKLSNLSIAVNEGDMLAAKFVNGSGPSAIAMSQQAYLALTITE